MHYSHMTMSELTVALAEQFSDPERIHNAIWRIELAVHPNLNQHHNLETITAAFKDDDGVTHGVTFSHTPAVEGTDTVYYPTLEIWTGERYNAYCQTDYDTVLEYHPERGEGRVQATPTAVSSMADGLEWLDDRVHLDPAFCQVDGQPLLA
jgi:hypothetical protein